VTFLKKLVPAPLTSAALLALWLMLARAVSAGQLLLGLALALVVPILTSNLRSTAVRVRRPLVVMRFILMVGHDVVVSSFEVAWGLVTWRWRRPRSKFVVVPLELRDPIGLAALAMVTTVVPGTVWSELALDRSAVLLHVWHVGDDERAFIAYYKARYEKPLREIFE
jgi:multicomponent K+:H+ antiporter subunit E